VCALRCLISKTIFLLTPNFWAVFNSESGLKNMSRTVLSVSLALLPRLPLRASADAIIAVAWCFANVAFSDGSLLHGFNQRIQKRQPIVAPNDIKRYFVTPQEAGELCLMSCIFGENRDIFFPKLSESLHLITFAEIAVKYLKVLDYEVDQCTSEEEARAKIKNSVDQKKWPCLFTESDTTGEKDFEEFFTTNETLDMERFMNLGIIKNEPFVESEKIDKFSKDIAEFKDKRQWTKEELVSLFNYMMPEFAHKETGKYLDAKM
jgi:FlaA1/EpsC-like NDP-sugar epimerase